MRSTPHAGAVTSTDGNNQMLTGSISLCLFTSPLLQKYGHEPGAGHSNPTPLARTECEQFKILEEPMKDIIPIRCPHVLRPCVRAQTTLIDTGKSQLCTPYSL
jgi:hypothetical protein